MPYRLEVRGKLPGQCVKRTFKLVKGRKDYLCSVCHEIIPKGEQAYRYATFTDSGPARTHVEHVEIVI